MKKAAIVCCVDNYKSLYFMKLKDIRAGLFDATDGSNHVRKTSQNSSKVFII